MNDENAATLPDALPVNTRRQLLRRAAMIAAGALLAGCQPQGKTGGTPATASNDGQDVRRSDTSTAGGGSGHTVPISNTDPCAERLHDICEPLLRYYLDNQELPPNLETLKQMKGFSTLELSCPVTKRPYVYSPVGIQNAVNKQRILIYDPAPVHAGMRWAVVIVSPEGDRALVTKVVALAESNFTLQIPANR